MQQNTLNIGFIGLGKMGAGICSNIQKAGFPLIVYNRTRAKTERFANEGAIIANSPREVAQNSDIILTSIMDDASLLDICNREDGIFAGLKPGTIHIGLTTILPSTSNTLEEMHKEKSCHYIAGPIAGRPDAAEAGKLVSFLGGESQAIETSRPLISSYSETILPVGDIPGTASAMKICANYMMMTQLVMLGEIFTFADKRGLNKEMILMMATTFFSGGGPMVYYSQKIKNRTFDDVGFDLTGGLKDAILFEKAFVDVGVRPGIISIAKENFVAAAANGLGKKDWSALTEMTRRAAGLENQVDLLKGIH